MAYIQTKKSLGQHLLKDNNIATKIVESLNVNNNDLVIEIGAGTGVLTNLLCKIYNNLYVVEIDIRMVNILIETLPELKEKLIHESIINYDLKQLNNNSISLIGNLPYNISSQIFFKLIENKDIINTAVFMIQKEVAERIASKHGNKTYGILSVLLQAYYNTEYLFTVNESAFIPPPNVKSAVIRLTRNKVYKLDCDEKLFLKVVKTSFNQRRKMISNSLKSMLNLNKIDDDIMNKRPEQLSVEQFVYLTNLVEKYNK